MSYPAHANEAAQALAYARQTAAALPEAKAAGPPLADMLRDKALGTHLRSVTTLARLLNTRIEQAGAPPCPRPVLPTLWALVHLQSSCQGKGPSGVDGLVWQWQLCFSQLADVVLLIKTSILVNAVRLGNKASLFARVSDCGRKAAGV